MYALTLPLALVALPFLVVAEPSEFTTVVREVVRPLSKSSSLGPGFTTYFIPVVLPVPVANQPAVSVLLDALTSVAIPYSTVYYVKPSPTSTEVVTTHLVVPGAASHTSPSIGHTVSLAKDTTRAASAPLTMPSPSSTTTTTELLTSTLTRGTPTTLSTLPITITPATTTAAPPAFTGGASSHRARAFVLAGLFGYLSLALTVL